MDRSPWATVPAQAAAAPLECMEQLQSMRSRQPARFKLQSARCSSIWRRFHRSSPQDAANPSSIWHACIGSRRQGAHAPPYVAHPLGLRCKLVHVRGVLAGGQQGWLVVVPSALRAHFTVTLVCLVHTPTVTCPSYIYNLLCLSCTLTVIRPTCKYTLSMSVMHTHRQMYIMYIYPFYASHAHPLSCVHHAHIPFLCLSCTHPAQPKPSSLQASLRAPLVGAGRCASNCTQVRCAAKSKLCEVAAHTPKLQKCLIAQLHYSYDLKLPGILVKADFLVDFLHLRVLDRQVSQVARPLQASLMIYVNGNCRRARRELHPSQIQVSKHAAKMQKRLQNS